MKKVQIFTDGACSGNPGPGGWAAVLIYMGHEKEISGCEADTTNNRMEMTAVIKALECLKEECEVTVTTDSQYIANAFRNGWVENWISNGFRTSSKKPVKNKDLWERLLELRDGHHVSFEWIEGHAGHLYNERCDSMARAEIAALSKKL